jgi:hypothetical protein
VSRASSGRPRDRASTAAPAERPGAARPAASPRPRCAPGRVHHDRLHPHLERGRSRSEPHQPHRIRQGGADRARRSARGRWPSCIWRCTTRTPPYGVTLPDCRPISPDCRPAPAGASPRGRGGAAAHATLSALFTRQTATFDAALARHGNPADPGHAFGVAVARSLLADRAADPGVEDAGYTPSRSPSGTAPTPTTPARVPRAVLRRAVQGLSPSRRGTSSTRPRAAAGLRPRAEAGARQGDHARVDRHAPRPVRRRQAHAGRDPPSAFLGVRRRNRVGNAAPACTTRSSAAWRSPGATRRARTPACSH